MAKRSRKSGLRVVNDINVTPLMDLTFLLLIVFMITAPTLEYETDVTPPSMETSETIDENKKPLMINLTEEGKIMFKKQVVSREVLAAELAVAALNNPKVAVLIRADEDRRYGDVMDLMKVARKAKVHKISLVTQPES